MWWKALANSLAHGTYTVGKLIYSCEECGSQDIEFLQWDKIVGVENEVLISFVGICSDCGRIESTTIISRKV